MGFRARSSRLVVGLGGGLVVGLDFGPSSEKIIYAETISWSWPRERDLVVVLVVVLVVGPVFGVVVLGGGLGGLVVGLVGGLVGWLVSWLPGGLSFSEIETRDIPNQGIHRSAWNALVVGLVFGLVSGLVFGLVVGLVVGLVSGLVGGLVGGLVSGLVSGLVGGLIAGGRACLKHLALRLLLVRSGLIPWNYVKFLDYAAERILLRKIGGGYTFIHRMLLEYFATRYDGSSVEAAPEEGKGDVTDIDLLRGEGALRTRT